MNSVTQGFADRLIDAALKKGHELKLAPLTIAVLDAGGHHLALKRADHSGIFRVEIASGKAYGAFGMGFDSRELGERSQKMPVFFGALAAASGGRMVPVAGGVLIRSADNHVVGAVGISDDTSDNDEVCAIAGTATAQAG
jgi:uncharacterized protein GlcG (DUF336 family)